MARTQYQAAAEDTRVYWKPGDPKPPVVWEAQGDAQRAFLSCPYQEALFHGNRGGGKTDSLVMDFAQDTHSGFGRHWVGVLFRQTYPQLEDVVNKTRATFPRMFPGQCDFNEQKMKWVWDSGAVLYLRHIRRVEDYWAYHGHSFAWIGWEELTSWPTPDCYLKIMTLLRTVHPGILKRVRATTNPFGPGHGWVKFRFRLPAMDCRAIKDAKTEQGRPEPIRVAIRSDVRQNKILLKTNPHYLDEIAAAATSDAEREAWVEGSWDIAAGGIFSSVWYECSRWIIIRPFSIPQSWFIDRGFDWGESKPFVVLWYAQSDGSDVKMPDGRVRATVPGDLFVIREWYGMKPGKPNVGTGLLATQISAGIVERELLWGLHGRVNAGPADNAIFGKNNGNCIAEDFKKRVRIGDRTYPGVTWVEGNKDPGSRVPGWALIKTKFRATKPPASGVREQPGLYVFDICEHFLRTIPVLPADEVKMDDVDTNSEDHIADTLRYKVLTKRRISSTGTTRGM